MLEDKEEVQAALKHQHTGQPKAVDCIRVDGAVDEGPAHHEVQFWWTVIQQVLNQLQNLNYQIPYIRVYHWGNLWAEGRDLH